MAHVLLIDDDAEALLSLARALKTSGLDAAIDAASSADRALQVMQLTPPHVVVLDLSLDEALGVESGFALLRKIESQFPLCRVIVLTGHGAAEFGIRSLELGAANFLQKPADIPHLAALVRDGIAQSELKREHQRLLREDAQPATSRLIGTSDAIAKVREQVAYAASNNQAVVILGETGTGKGRCAREIHRLSSRRSGNFMPYQPSFGTADLVNSDLFGHVKGAFTGAAEARRGLIADADHGTLFLDEVDQLPIETQVSMLSVLQDKLVRAIGSNKADVVDFRLICASNADLEKCTTQGTLRRDFYHRIAHFTLTLPPLRSRKQDLSLLAHSVLANLREREPVNVFGIEPDALQKLTTYDWPGNVRELEAVVEGAAYHAQFKERTRIFGEDVLFSGSSFNATESEASYIEKVEAYKLKLIQDALSAYAGNQVKTAEFLKLDRATMRRILARGDR